MRMWSYSTFQDIYIVAYCYTGAKDVWNVDDPAHLHKYSLMISFFGYFVCVCLDYLSVYTHTKSTV